MLKKGIKYVGMKEQTTLTILSRHATDPGRKVRFAKGEIKVIGVDISEMQADYFFSEFRDLVKSVDVEADAKEYLLSRFQGLAREVGEELGDGELLDVFAEAFEVNIAGALAGFDPLKTVDAAQEEIPKEEPPKKKAKAKPKKRKARRRPKKKKE